MLQGYILDDDMAYNRYASVVGKEYMTSLKIAAEREPLVLGIKAVQSPNAEIKQEILNSARIAMQPKDGISALSMGEYLYIVNELLNNSGIEHARLIISSREQEAEEKRIRDLMEVRIKPNCISFIYKQYGKKMQQPITLYKNEDSKLVNFYPYGELISLLNEIEAKKSLKEKRW